MEESAVASWYSRLARSRVSYLVIAATALFSAIGFYTYYGVSGPAVHDEFAYMKAAETFASGRITNPQHPLWPFFETLYVLVKPTQMSRFPPAQSAFMAVGILLGHPIFGVWISCILLCCSTRWMVGAFFSPNWSLAAGLYLSVHLCWFHYWSNSFWGGAVAAFAGCLAIGGALRISMGERSLLDSSLLGVGLLVLSISRPFEGVVLGLLLAVILLYHLFRGGWKSPHTISRFVLPVAGLMALTLLLNGYYNYKVTGDPLVFPYTLWEGEYLRIPLFLWDDVQESPVYQTEFMQNFRRDVALPVALSHQWIYGFERVRYSVVSFLGLGGALIVLASVFSFRDRKLWLILAITTCFALTLFVARGYFPHYHAPGFGLYVMLFVFGIRAVVNVPLISKLRGSPVLLIVFVLACSKMNSIDRPYEGTLHSLVPFRNVVISCLNERGGKYVVIKRDSLDPMYHYEWVYNEPDIDSSNIVWARDRGEENVLLKEYYKDREFVYLDWGKDVFQIVAEDGEVILFSFDNRENSVIAAH